jgi:DNA-binding MarR family transcriptional regulator
MLIEEIKQKLLDHSKRINDCTNLMLNSEGACHGLTVMQLRLLMELFRTGSLTIGGIAEHMGLAGANVSTMCKKLEQFGYLQRSRDLQDERIVRVALTNAGEDMLLKIDTQMTAKISRMVENVSETTLVDMLACLEQFSLMLGKLSIEHNPEEEIES